MREVELMEYEDREFFDQVMSTAYQSLTDRQWECLMMQVAGFTQEQVGRVLDISQQAVGQHFQAALGKVAAIAQSDTCNGG